MSVFRKCPDDCDFLEWSNWGLTNYEPHNFLDMKWCFTQRGVLVWLANVFWILHGHEGQNHQQRHFHLHSWPPNLQLASRRGVPKEFRWISGSSVWADLQSGKIPVRDVLSSTSQTRHGIMKSFNKVRWMILKRLFIFIENGKTCVAMKNESFKSKLYLSILYFLYQ